MGMSESISRMLKDTCVYWGNPVNNGEGGFTFNNPVELNCRWEDIEQVVTDTKGNEITSRSLVFLEQDVDIEGYLFRGTLEDMYDLTGESSSGGDDNPKLVAGAYIIKRYQKTPSLDGTGYLRKAYLTPSLSFGGF